MSRVALKDARYQIVGYIETSGDGRQQGLNARYRVLGYFDPVRNETKDARYRVVGHGNTLSALIFGCQLR